VKILFLCSGAGKRMYPLTEDKFLFKFLGKSLLEHQIELAQKAGISDFTLSAIPAILNALSRSPSMSGMPP
jgi:NDP-sugar pyrophosphorylase family protein